MKKRSTFSWVIHFAGRKKSFYIGSVLLAIIGVAMSFAPYLIIAKIVGMLLSKDMNFSDYSTLILLMAVCWVLRCTFHSISTTLSHIAFTSERI